MVRILKPLVTNHGQGLSGTYYCCQDLPAARVQGLPTIPPERVGPNGEYDHYGLAKRVYASLSRQFGHDVAALLKLRQRGSAILISGQVPSWAIAEQLTQFILTIEGATQVELYQLQVRDACRRLPVLSA